MDDQKLGEDSTVIKNASMVTITGQRPLPTTWVLCEGLRTQIQPQGDGKREVGT